MKHRSSGAGWIRSDEKRGRRWRRLSTLRHLALDLAQRRGIEGEKKPELLSWRPHIHGLDLELRPESASSPHLVTERRAAQKVENEAYVLQATKLDQRSRKRPPIAGSSLGHVLGGPKE